QLGEREARAESANRVDSGIDDARAVRQRVNADAKFVQARDAAVGDGPRALVHPEIDHAAPTRRHSDNRYATAAAGVERAASAPTSHARSRTGRPVGSAAALARNAPDPPTTTTPGDAGDSRLNTCRMP